MHFPHTGESEPEGTHPFQGRTRSCCHASGEISEARNRKDAGGGEEGPTSEEKPVDVDLDPLTSQWPRSARFWIWLFHHLKRPCVFPAVHRGKPLNRSEPGSLLCEMRGASLSLIMANKDAPAGCLVLKPAPRIQADGGHLQAEMTCTEAVNWCRVSSVTAFLINYEQIVFASQKFVGEQEQCQEVWRGRVIGAFLKLPAVVAQFIWFVKIKTERKMPEVRSSGRAGTRTSFCILWTCLIPGPSGNVLKIPSESIPSMSWTVGSETEDQRPAVGKDSIRWHHGLCTKQVAAGGSDQAVGPSTPAIRFSCMHPGCIDTPGTNGRCGNRGCSSQHRGSAPALINHGPPVREICLALKPLLWMSVYWEGKLSSLGHETAAPPAFTSRAS
ncbi:uncharacterized protein LOC102163801 isoform X3 [Sus scrofa]|uniref:uncharacterized protein LOC102163801 isoform X3 n=1 Tax=Sus scrofa TaxID=9823 RepID=UPI000A2B4C41|nr:uncharacterized protein LOC102163801 isoform X3 [Sus scrofa]